MFRFTIRELLLATAIVGVLAAWRVDHRAQYYEASLWRCRFLTLMIVSRDRHDTTIRWDDEGVHICYPGEYVFNRVPREH